MKDRQVEVVAGNHAVARVAGAVLVVAHRGPGEPTADSTASLALESLAELVAEAAHLHPEGPGAQVARQATRWLMKHAEQISPGVPIDFGILSAAENGGVAIFLHGAVTAVLAGDNGDQRYRGSDAAFTVDRVAAAPARGVALFIDDEKGRIPEVPRARGIGWLVEGIARAGGAVLWTDGARAHRPVASPAQESGPPVPTARIDAEPRRESDSREPRRAPEPGPHHAATQASTSMMDQVGEDSDPQLAQTMIGGTNPAPEPDPDLQRRLEATAKATALTVKVMGFKCARAHPSDPRSAFCTVCGMPVDQTQSLIEVIRPPLGMLVLDDGMTYMLAADAVIGRDPEHSEAAQRGLVPLKVDDTSGGMSRAHAEIRLVNWDVTLVDRGSTNGTRSRLPGYRDWVRLHPNQPMTLVPGTEIMIGNRVLRFEPAAPPPFG
ncbi:FHA domain-containing protein [Nocardia puris]|uniref:PSer/pThr/pTyr-binding forkhead associated (FHA) protein n=1 Tax=Nocardia puris TaxID=208602 RepID=A0A366DFL5_9NOCA|nr:FHA domain-containing protein [Nocardia puris]MBF6212500.1 FHA domain-containing protein [Nocardia puris]MBF6366747.1 FHA domain-containing protein [Nocardia puris]MBF6461089.1 FHA domain-containing protein [Nocardia puris]RBO88860.1 pSer/pThr/pTyr-binding forkhead associated (FHA) protein [Nocardia puris]